MWPRLNGRHFPDDIFKRTFLNENYIWIKIPLKFVPQGPINTIPALVQMMACRLDRWQVFIWTNDEFNDEYAPHSVSMG